MAFMFTTEPGRNRWKLGFKEAVLHNFGFLRSYGMAPVTEEVTLVRYESECVFVIVYHGRASYEIGVELGRTDRPEKYGLGHVVWQADKEVYKAEGFGGAVMFQVSTADGVSRIVPKVVALLEKYGHAFLSGSTAFYEELARANERASIAYQRDQMLTRIRQEAEAAWAAKDYARVAELYHPIEEELTKIERKRHSYAARVSGTFHREAVHQPDPC